MRYLSLSILLSALIFTQEMNGQIHQELSQQYESFKESSISTRRFKHGDIQPLIQRLRQDSRFSVVKLGESIEGRDISMVSIGSGKIHVLLWSQMHGNESTATMALLDIFNFFSQGETFENFKAQLLQNLTLHFIPMLNPDGAEKFTRRNANGVDLNRDALRLQNPEAKILKGIRDSLDADWGFNLHDQGRYYAAGPTSHTASISFLAPAYNYEKEVNENRGNAMRLIGIMHEVLQQYIPHKIGRYNDDFEPRAFGDNIQKWGTKTILIESGGLKDDREKQVLRKMNFLILMEAFNAISLSTYIETPMSIYESIPFNSYNSLHDLILRKVKILNEENSYTLDLAIRRHEVEYDNHRKYYLRSSIQDIGDLSTSKAYAEFDAGGYDVSIGKVYPKKFKKLKKLKLEDPIALLSAGYTKLKLKKLPEPWRTSSSPLEIGGLLVHEYPPINLGYNPALVFRKADQVKFVLVNGFLYDLEKDVAKIREAFQAF